MDDKRYVFKSFEDTDIPKKKRSALVNNISETPLSPSLRKPLLAERDRWGSIQLPPTAENVEKSSSLPTGISNSATTSAEKVLSLTKRATSTVSSPSDTVNTNPKTPIRSSLSSNLSLLNPLFAELPTIRIDITNTGKDITSTVSANVEKSSSPANGITDSATTGAGKVLSLTKCATSTVYPPSDTANTNPKTPIRPSLSSNLSLQNPLFAELPPIGIDTTNTGKDITSTVSASSDDSMFILKGKGSLESFHTLVEVAMFVAEHDYPKKPPKRKGRALIVMKVNKRKISRPVYEASSMELPLYMAEMVYAKGGRNVEYVFSKDIQASDVNPSQSRLNVPKDKVEPILTQTEIDQLIKESRKLHVLVVDSRCREWHMTFGWRPSIQNYVFITTWNAFVTENHIKANCHEVHVWSFRLTQPGGKEERLCFAINVKIV